MSLGQPISQVSLFNSLPLAAAKPALGPLGSLDSYIQVVNRIPIIGASDERQLATEYRLHGNLEAARQLVLSHLRLVVSITRHYLGYSLPHADLIQEGNIGLMKAVKRFDPNKNVRLVSYAVHWIKAEIHDLAQALKLRPEDVREMETRLSGGDIVLEGQTEDGEAAFAPISYLADTQQEPSEVLNARQFDRLQSEGLANALSMLDKRSRRIVKARWLDIEDDGSGGATLHELADEFGVSAERIRQIETSAMKRMKQALIPYVS